MQGQIDLASTGMDLWISSSNIAKLWEFDLDRVAQSQVDRAALYIFGS